MSFLNPIMLAGLSAIAIPIIIHLLNRRKFQKVVWAAMRFLQLSIEKNQRRMEIEDMILLVLRCLLVAMIALALARPTVREAVGAFLNGGKSVGVLLLDTLFTAAGRGRATSFLQSFGGIHSGVRIGAGRARSAAGTTALCCPAHWWQVFL